MTRAGHGRPRWGLGVPLAAGGASEEFSRSLPEAGGTGLASVVYRACLRPSTHSSPLVA